MLNVNPFSALAETVSPLAMQGFIIAMISLIALGTIIQMINHKNLTYFLNNAKKAKLQATREIGTGERVSILAKTAVVDIGTTSETWIWKKKIISCAWNVWNYNFLGIISNVSILLYRC